MFRCFSSSHFFFNLNILLLSFSTFSNNFTCVLIFASIVFKDSAVVFVHKSMTNFTMFCSLMKFNKHFFYFKGMNIRREKVSRGKKIAKFQRMTSNDVFDENLTFANDYLMR